MTLNEHYDQFIADKAQYVTRRTVDNYNTYYRLYIAPAFGAQDITTIERRDVVDQFNRWQNTGAPVVGIRKYLRAICGNLPRNPAAGLRVPRKIPRYITLDHSQMQRAIECGKNHRYYPMFLTLALTGMRPTELRGLQWRDVDGDTIYIQHIYDRGQVGATKTAGSTRSFKIPQRLVTALRDLRAQSTSEWVFVSRFNRPIDASSTIRQRLGVFFGDVGVKYVRPYSCRHYFAARLVDLGVPLPTIQRFGGWSNERMVLYYAAQISLQGMAQACALLDSDDF